MTYEEALVRFKAFSEFCDDRNEACDNNCDKCNAMESAIIEALEKQIPKKPKTTYDWDMLIRWNCPECLRTIDSPMGYSVAKHPFCPYCGQAIDWTGICEGKWNDYEEVK